MEKENEGRILTDDEKTKYEASVTRLCYFPPKVVSNQEAPTANHKSIAKQDSLLFRLMFISKSNGLYSPRAVVEALISFPAGRAAFDSFHGDYSRTIFHIGIPSVLLQLIKQCRLVSSASSTRFISAESPSLKAKLSTVPIHLSPSPDFGRTSFKC